MLLELSLALLGTGVAVTAGPRICARCVAETFQHMLQDQAFRETMRQALKDTFDEAAQHEEQLAQTIWGEAGRAGLGEAIVELFHRPDFHDACAKVASHVTQDETLKDTIRKGVAEALRDQHIKLHAKALLIEGAQDAELRAALLRSAIAIVKGGIRESMTDLEFKEVVTEAIRESLLDRRVLDMLKQVIIDAVSDEEIHRAMRQGALAAIRSDIEVPWFRGRPAASGDAHSSNSMPLHLDCRVPTVTEEMDYCSQQAGMSSTDAFAADQDDTADRPTHHKLDSKDAEWTTL